MTGYTSDDAYNSYPFLLTPEGKGGHYRPPAQRKHQGLRSNPGRWLWSAVMALDPRSKGVARWLQSPDRLAVLPELPSKDPSCGSDGNGKFAYVPVARTDLPPSND